MKLLLLLSTLWTLPALAKVECKSAYLVQPYKICAHAMHGADPTQARTGPFSLSLQSDWLRGGQDQRWVCESLRSKYEFDNSLVGAKATLIQSTPVAESREKILGVARYQYTCNVSVTQYPPRELRGVHCGVSEHEFNVLPNAHMLELFMVNRTAMVGKVSCLTCDSTERASLEKHVDCLRDNSKLILSSSRETLVPEQQQQLVQAVRDLQDSVRMAGGVQNLQTQEQIAPLRDILRRYDDRQRR
ncbi:MAG: hypothetical protein AB7N80_05300 [Bdellovibrionales bacterium]